MTWNQASNSVIIAPICIAPGVKIPDAFPLNVPYTPT